MTVKKYSFYALVLAIFFAFGALSSSAQTANIRGFVYLKKTGEPLLYTNVYLENTTYGAQTDVNGFFSITKVPPGTYNLIVAYLGYDTLRESITLTKDQILTKKLYVQESSIQLEGVHISASEQARKTETPGQRPAKGENRNEFIRASVILIEPHELLQLRPLPSLRLHSFHAIFSAMQHLLQIERFLTRQK